MRTHLLGILAACLLFGINSEVKAAQRDLGTIGGTITDFTTCLRLPGVNVTRIDAGTGVQITTLTNDSGDYLFASVPPGRYTLTANRMGFTQIKILDIKVDPGSNVRLSPVLDWLSPLNGDLTNIHADNITLSNQGTYFRGHAHLMMGPFEFDAVEMDLDPVIHRIQLKENVSMSYYPRQQAQSAFLPLDPGIFISADKQAVSGRITQFRGHARIVTNTVEILADEMDGNYESRRIAMRGNVSIRLLEWTSPSRPTISIPVLECTDPH